MDNGYEFYRTFLVNGVFTPPAHSGEDNGWKAEIKAQHS